MRNPLPPASRPGRRERRPIALRLQPHARHSHHPFSTRPVGARLTSESRPRFLAASNNAASSPGQHGVPCPGLDFHRRLVSPAREQLC
ncbi:hypothetical protein D623_10011669 [Myotis brandtii]|uniref:Uncharacterized protein n=1 Tax=Myotis brandtii TaxID=109478 RepID=S7Q9K3_MYOBR|nr:hypothetical protein D623_10011669 [Myotis brandtii]